MYCNNSSADDVLSTWYVEHAEQTRCVNLLVKSEHHVHNSSLQLHMNIDAFWIEYIFPRTHASNHIAIKSHMNSAHVFTVAVRLASRALGIRSRCGIMVISLLLISENVS